jgi:SlyX protein
MDLTALEERVAHLMRTVDDLSDVVAAQAKALDRMDRLTRMLAARDADRDGQGDVPGANVKPPHW